MPVLQAFAVDVDGGAIALPTSQTRAENRQAGPDN